MSAGVNSTRGEEESRRPRPAGVDRASRSCLIAIIIASLAFVKDLFLVVVAVAMVVGLWEMGRALGDQRHLDAGHPDGGRLRSA